MIDPKNTKPPKFIFDDLENSNLTNSDLSKEDLKKLLDMTIQVAFEMYKENRKIRVIYNTISLVLFINALILAIIFLWR